MWFESLNLAPESDATAGHNLLLCPVLLFIFINFLGGNMYIIGDLTAIIPEKSSENQVVRTVMERYKEKDTDFYVIGYKEQLFRLTDEVKQRMKELDEIDNSMTNEQILDIIDQKYISKLRDDSPSEEILVLSFNQKVRWLIKEKHNNVIVKSWSDVHKELTGQDKNTEKDQNSEKIWPESLIPKKDAISTLCRALQEQKAVQEHKSVRQSDIVPMLGTIDQRFKTSFPKRSGLIKVLLSDAKEQGYIELDDTTDQINPTVWLSDKGKKESDPRFWAFSDCLRSKQLGPFAKIREQLYVNIERFIDSNSQEPSTIYAILSKSIENVKPNQNDNKYPWRRVKYFLYNLLSRRSIFMSGDNVIDMSFSNFLSATTTGCVKEWQTQLDAELILAIAEKVSEITFPGDVDILAGLLYSDRSEGSVDKILNLIKYLLESKQLVEQKTDGIEQELSFCIPPKAV